MADVTLVKGENAALDRTWMSMPDGSTRQLAVHVVHDLPHLVVESLFGLEDGLWGVLARGGFSAANRARALSRGRRARLVTDLPLDELAAGNWTGHLVAKAATNAVVNRWRDGPDTPAGVRARLTPAPRSAASLPVASLPVASPSVASPSVDRAGAEYRQRIADLLGRLDDATIALAIGGTSKLSTEWDRLPAGGILRLQWPLPPRALRS